MSVEYYDGEHFNGLTPAEAERLALLAEECAECVQACMKILRHGYHSYDPTAAPHDRMSNRMMLAREIGDVQCVVNMMCTAFDVDRRAINSRAVEKHVTVQRWLHHGS